MRRLVIASLAALPLALAAAPAAPAATVSCTYGTYFPGSEDEEPRISNLKARNLPRRTSDYAPPCLVAESVAGLVQLGAADGGTPPAKVTAMGARWYGGVYRCTYEGTSATCRKTGKPRRRVTFSLGA